jgi:hypothetical protein
MNNNPNQKTQHRCQYEECPCTCPACRDNECESSCLNQNCTETLCRDPGCRIRSARAEIAVEAGTAYTC